MPRNKYHFYASFPDGFIDLRSTARGVEIELTKLEPGGQQVMSAVISRFEFQQLLYDAPELLDGIDLLRDEAMRKRGYPI